MTADYHRHAITLEQWQEWAKTARRNRTDGFIERRTRNLEPIPKGLSPVDEYLNQIKETTT